MWNQDFDVVIIDEATQALEAVSVALVTVDMQSIHSPVEGLLDPNIQGEEINLSWRSHAAAANYPLAQQ